MLIRSAPTGLVRRQARLMVCAAVSCMKLLTHDGTGPTAVSSGLPNEAVTKAIRKAEPCDNEQMIMPWNHVEPAVSGEIGLSSSRITRNMLLGILS